MSALSRSSEPPVRVSNTDAGLPTVVGAIPPELAAHFQAISAPPLPEIARLPRPGERDPICSASRSWLIDTNAALRPQDRFLFSIRQRGKIRGAVFINVAKLLAFMQKAQEEEMKNAAMLEADPSTEMVTA
jgi:hypothetical protein